jgi:hypothetical protein
MKKARLHKQGLHTQWLDTRGSQNRGFTLIASLLLLLLLSGIAIGLMMMVNTEGRVGSTDLQNNVAFHSAEGGVEKMTSDLASAFNNSLAPTAAQICNLSTQQPVIAGVTWKDYTVMPGPIGASCPTSLIAQYGQISSGPNQGLWAQIIPVNMLATAAEPGGQEVSMTRSAQVALIPVFQFGIFSDSDLSFFSGPNFDFAGRIHTNGDLYPEVGPGSTLTFHDDISAYGNVIRSQLPNGYTTASNYNGTVLIPTAPQGCDGTAPFPACRAIGLSEGSVTGAGGNPPQSGQVSGWPTLSVSTYNSEIIDGDYGLGNPKAGTGAKKLSMPFVGGNNLPNEIIRVPPTGESPTGALGASREYNLAQIHVLLTDDPAELPGGAGDANNVRLANVTGSNVFGIPTSVPSTLPSLGAGKSYSTMFAAAYTYIADPSSCAGVACTTGTLSQDWPLAPATPAAGAETLVPFTPLPAPVTLKGGSPAPTLSVCNTATCVLPYYSTSANAANAAAWNLIDGYLRVEYKDAGGAWHPVTMEWLKLGFARGLTPPTAPGTNPINPNAILLLQEPADRNGNGVIDAVGKAPVCTKKGGVTTCTFALPPEVVPDNTIPTVSGSPWYGVSSTSTVTAGWTGSNYYPINFYDVREGEARDTDGGNNSCTTNGVMNAVEIDVGNLKKWLLGNIGTSGTSVDYVAQNGYVLYFSDRRGMLVNPNVGRKSGDSGLEDVVNTSSSAGVPDGALEPIQSGQTVSPEDVNQNGHLDEFGTANLGLGQYNGTVNQNKQITLASPDNPFLPRITSCSTSARKNWVSGARHVLKLVDGSFGNVPLSPVGTVSDPGGFTVAAENPVYIQGDYNSNAADPTWTGGADIAGHSSTSVIADAVTFLSNQWNDNLSMTSTDTTLPGNRPASSTYYRVAIAGGKNISFPKPSWGANDFGTDGGVHNFLRYLENWGSATLHYKGSLVSLYYSTYSTGTFKCCTTVYSPPTRAYSFDFDFSSPQGLPPGTPLFRDVNSLGYRQMFTARTN